MRTNLARRAMRGAQEGVMLLEALVAILIFSVGVVAVMGMQAVSIEQVTQAKYRMDASYLANQIVGKMWTDQPNLATYATARRPWRPASPLSPRPSSRSRIEPNETITRKYLTQVNINPS